MGYKEMSYHHLYSNKISEDCVLLADRIFFGYSVYRIAYPAAVTELGSWASLSLSSIAIWQESQMSSSHWFAV